MPSQQEANQIPFIFHEAKVNFFSSNTEYTDHKVEKLANIKTTLKTFTYKSIYEQQLLIEKEFNDLFFVLEKNKKNHAAFWLYCYFCASLLEKYYQGYSNDKKAEEYKKHKARIKKHYKEQEILEDQHGFVHFLKNDFTEAFKDLLTTPRHASKVRDRAGYLNLLRIYWVFCRFFLERGLLLSKAVNLLDKLDDLLGLHTDIDHILSGFDMPSVALNYLSVGLFALRALVNIGAIIKHTCFPSREEAGLEWSTRLGNEINKRGLDIINHGGWAAVNFITNFNKICHIPGPVAGWIVVGFLFADVATLLYKRHEEKKAYLLKMHEYDKEKNELQAILESSQDQQQKHNCRARLAILEEQKRALEVDWKTKGSTLDLMVGATFLLMLGFTGSMLINPALGVMACYLVCVIAVAIYLSEDVYAKYQRSSLELDDINPEDKQKFEEAKQAYEAARNEFILTLVKYTLMPTMLIATYAVCWPAAVALTVLMIGYEVFKAYDKNHKKDKDGLILENTEEQEADPLIPDGDTFKPVLG